jgi:CHAT domain-containing protein/tetratricopeptide (TPR) repeat protein
MLFVAGEATTTTAAQRTLLSLRSGETVWRTLAPEQFDEYEIQLQANQIARVEAAAESGVLTLTAFDSAGAEIASAPEQLLSLTQTIWFRAETSGVFRLRVADEDKNDVTRKYRVALVEIRDAAADAAFARAQLTAQETRRRAAAKLRQKSSVDWDEVETPLQNLLADAKTRNDRILIAETLALLGRTAASQNKFDAALDFFRQAAAVSTEDGERESFALFYVGLSWQDLQKYDEAVAAYDEAAQKARRVRATTVEFAARLNQGVCRSLKGELRRAVEAFQAAEQAAQNPPIQNTAFALDMLFTAYVQLGDAENSLRTYSKLIRTAEAVKYRRLCAATVRLAFFYYNLQNYPAAFSTFDKARAQCESEKNAAEAALAETGLGAVSNALGENERALNFLNAALRKHRELKNKQGEGATLGALGIYYRSIGDKASAIKFLTEAQPILRFVRDAPLETLVSNALGATLLDAGETEKAAVAFDSALAICRRVGREDLAAVALYGLAQTERRRGNLDKARAQIEEALTLAEKQRGAIASDNLRVAYAVSVSDFYDFYVDLLLSQHRQNPQANFDRAAFEISERGRARSLLARLRENGVDIRAGVPADLLRREQILRQDLNAQSAVLSKLFAAFFPPKAQIEKARAELARLAIEDEQIQAQIRAANPNYAALTQPVPLDLLAIQKQLDADTILLEYSLGEERSALFVVGKNFFKLIELPARGEIESAVWQLRRLLTARENKNGAAQINQADRDFKTESAKLAAILIPANEIQNKRLAIVPSGALHFLPFSSLVLRPRSFANSENRKQETNDDEQFLIETNEITVLPSASILGAQREILINRTTAKTLAVFADPVYERDDPRLRKTAKTGGKQSQTRSDCNAAAEINFLNQCGEQIGNLRRLPFSRREANQILALVPNAADKLAALDFAANLQRAVSDDLQNFRILHFAAHGTIDAVNPQFSGVILSLWNENGEPRNGLLKLQDVYNLRLNADLVVLSACRTGLGKQAKGEGVLSLTRGFMYAGSRRVVASQWKVQDDAAADLMTRFYQSVLRDKQSPAAALRTAQLALLEKPNFAAPFYWAAFVHYGEWL